MISAIISRVVILLFGTLYPAYASYKAVRTKNVKEYVKWMMYWIVYAFFTCIETFTDIFLAWFPFYYEIKVLIVLWLLSPATKGSSTLYRKFVHPMLTRREPEIDEYINQAKEKGYTAVLQLGSKGVNYATNVIMQTALKGGGNLVQTIRRSYSLSDLSEPDDQRTQDEIDEVGRPQRLLRPRTQTARSSSGGRNVDMYFSEVDVGPKAPQPNFNYIRSSDDISSGYSSAEPVSTGLSRTASLTNATKPRFKAKRAEDDIHLDNDELEEISKVCSPSQNDPYFAYNSNYYPNPNLYRMSSVTQRLMPEMIDELKNQAFLDNEKYLQDMIIKNACRNDSGSKQGPSAELQNKAETTNNFEKCDGSSSLDPIQQISKQIELPVPQHKSEAITQENIVDTSQESKESFQHLPEILASKYELFFKWLEDNEKLKADDLLNEVTNYSADKESLPSQMDEEFHDINTGSDDEMFHDVESTGNHNQSNSDQALINMKHEDGLHGEAEITHENSIEKTQQDGNSLPSILDDFTATSKSSAVEAKRHVSHQKGKAPDPPNIFSDVKHDKFSALVAGVDTTNTFTNIIQSSSKNEARNSSISSDLPEVIRDLNASKVQLNENVGQESRSPSPRLETKSKTGKMNLFKSYLPSLFKPESPKPNPSTTDNDNDYPRETQI